MTASATRTDRCALTDLAAPPRLPTTYDEFLFARAGDGAHEASMLSLMARLDLDPWEQAAALARLSETAAVETLEAMVGRRRLADGRGTVVATRRLIRLLHSASGAPSAKASGSSCSRRHEAEGAAFAVCMFIAVALCVIGLRMLADSPEVASGHESGQNPADLPIVGAAFDATPG
jgi:hypothetical protein